MAILSKGNKELLLIGNMHTERDTTEVIPDLSKLIRGCSKGDRVSQKSLYDYCFSAMMKVCMRYHKDIHDAATSFNAAMLKVFRNINQFRGEGDFLAWVRKIMVNTCLTALRSETKFEYEISGDHPSASFVPDIYQQLQAKQILTIVHELDITHKLVFNLFVMEGYSHDEIGKKLNIASGTSKWYLHEARKQLQKKLKSECSHESNSNAI